VLILALVKSEKLPALREAFFLSGETIWEIDLLKIKGVPYVRVLMFCQNPMTVIDSYEMIFETVIERSDYCLKCGKRLRSTNKHGYCLRHRDKAEYRKQRKS
jgi:hypothetical protein